jgi:putative copper export protein/mono/diheme cytochrome c family protein
VRAAILIGLGIVLFRARWRWVASARSNPALLFAALLGFLLLATQSLNSHNAAVNDPPIAPFIADLIHLLGVAVWVGGLLQLLATLPAFIRALPESRRTHALSSIIAAFSLVAFVTVGVIIVTGAYTLLIQVGSLNAFFGTLYGTTLFVKFLLILPLLALGALNLIVTRPASAHSLAAHVNRFLLRFDLAVALEVIFATGVLMAVGMLTSIPPAKSVYDPAPWLWMETRRADDLTVTLGIAPGLAGTNDFDVKIQNADGQPIADALLVRLLGKMREMDMGVEQVAAANQGGGHYTLHGDLMSMVGTWDLQVLVRRRGVDDVLTQFSLPALGQRLPQANPPLIAASPEAQVGLGLTLFGLAFGTASVLLLKRRQMRWLSLGGALLVSIVGAFVVYQVSTNAPAASAYVVPVVPEFARLTRSPIPPALNQIAAGQQLYAENCATCHGVTGKGDGPSASNLIPKPADLTIHVPMHSDGELYWWITHGITTTAMPAWDTRLSDLQRWQMVQFIRTFGVKATPVPPVGSTVPGG